ncbi:MAG: cyclic nucleotide-binding domain-containing protein [Ilumatobacter sp.]|nr:cyclic nucleotide-binding domain-containing protein [Ilumatobacter sp.]
MFPIDSISTRQLHDADILVAAQQRRRRGVAHRSKAARRPDLQVLTRVVLAGLRPRRRVATGPLGASHELFVGLDAPQLEQLGQHLTVIDVPAGRSLGRQGALAHEFVTVIDGQVGVTIDGVPNAVFDDGSHFGALPLLEDDRNPRHRASFSALVPTRIAVAGPAEFRALLARFPTVAARIRSMTKIRKAYLNGLADARPADTPEAANEAPVEYPAHIPA